LSSKGIMICVCMSNSLQCLTGGFAMID
jgi:hypothetical protein